MFSDNHLIIIDLLERILILMFLNITVLLVCLQAAGCCANNTVTC